MHVGGVRLNRVFEHGLQQLDDRRVLCPGRRRQGAEIDIGVPEVAFHCLGKAADLLGAPVDPVDGLQHLVFAYRSDLYLAFQRALHLIGGEQVGRIREPDQVFATPVLEDNGTEAARLRFRKTAHHFVVQVVELEIDVGNVELPGERLGNLLVVAKAVVHQHAPEPPSGAFLLLEGDTDLFTRNELLRE